MSEEEVQEGIRITDRRKIDPLTHEVRRPEAPAAEAGIIDAEAEPVLVDAEAAGAIAEATARAEEAVADAKRIAAEYANYRRRVDRDRELQRDMVVRAVLADLLPALDDVDRAREHGELSGGFKSVGEAVEGLAAKYGLERYGAEGEPFDPAVHEAMTSEHSDEVAEPTVVRVYQVGYRQRGMVVRPARVAVADNG